MKALKKLQLEATDIEAKFYEEVGVLGGGGITYRVSTILDTPLILQGVFFYWSYEKF